MDDFRSDFGLDDASSSNLSYDGSDDVMEGKHIADFDVSLMVFRVLICTVGTTGNLLVIFVILTLREYKKAVTHWYVLQLAIADTLFLLTLPFKVIEDVYDEWIFSDAMCRIKEGILFLNYYSSVLFLVIMSVDRYIAVCHGFTSSLQNLRTKRAAAIIAGATWITALLLCIPVFTYTSKMGVDPHCTCQYHFPNHKQSAEELCADSTIGMREEEYLACVEQEEKFRNMEMCTVIDYGAYDYHFEGSSGDNVSEDVTTVSDGSVETTADDSSQSGVVYEHGCTYAASGPGWKAFLSFNFIVMFVVPLIIMSICYTRIIMKLRRTRLRSDSNAHDETLPGSTSGQGSARLHRKRSKSVASIKADRNRNRVTIVCGALVMLFLACWLPFHTVHLAKMTGIQGSSHFCVTLSSAASIVAYLNSALNPYVYNFIGTRFKERISSASLSIRRSFKKRTSSLSSGGATVIYHAKKHNDNSSSTGNTGTVTTKIYRGTQRGNQHSSTCTNDVFDEDKHEQHPLVETENVTTPVETADKD